MPLYDLRSICLPYCLKLQPCGRYAALNREYSPLGWCVNDGTTHKELPILLTTRITPRMAIKLSCRNSEDIRNIYLYHDGCIPTAGKYEWEAYSNRLALLAKLTVDDGAKGMAIRTRNKKDASRLEQGQDFLQMNRGG